MERIFPAEPWSAEPSGDGLPAKLIRLAAAPPAWHQRFRGRWQSPESRFLRVLRALKAGVAAETNGVHERADFYFDVALDEFAELSADPHLFEALSEKCGGFDLRVAAAQELFLQTHVGFIAGRLQLHSAPSPDRRVLKHAAWAERALTFAGLSIDEESAARAWLRQLEIAALQRAGRHDEALGAFERSLESSSPAYFKDAYVEAVAGSTIAALDDTDSDEANRNNAGTLTGALARFGRVFDKLLDRPLAWERLAELSWRRVAALSAEQPPGDRIAIFQRAVDADPFNLAIHELDVRARFAVADLQDRIARIEAEAAAEGKVLNDKGQAIKRDAVNAFAEARNYLRSHDAAALQRAARESQARTIWTRLGLTLEDAAPQRALALIDAIGTALARSELDSTAIVAALAEELRARPGLHDLDASVVATRLLAIRSTPLQPASPAEPVVPQIVRSSEPLTIADDRVVAGWEDLVDWLFSGRGLKTRLSLAAGAVVVAAAATLTGYNSYVEATRQALFPRIMAAARDNDYQSVARMADQFLSRRPLNGGRQLDRAVEHAYSEALVNLFAQSPEVPSPSLVHAAQRYRQLVGEPQEERP
jgi:tetratricopeptide (TPR) repeat protein